MAAINPLQSVRASTAFVYAHTQNVTIDPIALSVLADKLAEGSIPDIKWDIVHHYTGQPEATAQYLLVLDALNFCFWPEPAWDYNRLALALKQTMLMEPERFEAKNLANMEPDDTRALLGDADDIPLLEQRTMLLREVGSVLESDWGGQAANLVRAAHQSAATLVGLIAANLPGFRDHAIYNGYPIYLYKRAQIAAGDLWGAFNGEGLGTFHDIDELTMFADYRVPQILLAEGVLVYAPELMDRINYEKIIPAGSSTEVEIRAITIYAVERLRDQLSARGRVMNSVQLDWLLWNIGEARQHDILPHHRTLTIYY